MIIILFCVAKQMFWCFFSLSFQDLLGYNRASRRDLRSYFVKTDNTNKETSSSSQKVTLVIQSSSNIPGETEIQYVQREIKNETAKHAKHYDNIQSKIKQETGSYALIYGTKATIDRFTKVYTKYSLKRTTINRSKERYKKNDLQSIRKRGRPNLVDDEMLKKMKVVIIG